MNFKKELPALVIIILPFLYLAYLWDKLPDKVPVHWNIKGQIDAYGDRHDLILLPFLLPLLVYIVFLIAPKLDPKNKLNQMGEKYQMIKFLMTTLTSALAIFIIHSARSESNLNSNYLIMLIGILFVIMGNYFKTIRENYFIGIRTPWTLEDEVVWKETHKLGGKLWFIGGLIVVISSLTLDREVGFIVFMVIAGLISVIPIVYSYLVFKNRRKRNQKASVG